jgi:hypothetical protein
MLIPLGQGLLSETRMPVGYFARRLFHHLGRSLSRGSTFCCANAESSIPEQ